MVETAVSHGILAAEARGQGGHDAGTLTGAVDGGIARDHLVQCGEGGRVIVVGGIAREQLGNTGGRGARNGIHGDLM